LNLREMYDVLTEVFVDITGGRLVAYLQELGCVVYENGYIESGLFGLEPPPGPETRTKEIERELKNWASAEQGQKSFLVR